MSEKIERFTLYSTVGIIILLSVLDFVGILDNVPWLAGRTLSFVLLVVAIIASFLVSERYGKLEKIEQSILSNTDKILSSLSGVEAKLIPSADEGLEYMAKRIALAEHKIDHAALAPPIQRRPAHSNKWEQAIGKTLKGNKVMYRYIASFSDKARVDRVQNYISNPAIQKYYVKHYETHSDSPPTLSFVLIDDAEIIMHYPYEPGQAEAFLAIKHPDVIRLFDAYFKTLWNSARTVNSSELERMVQEVK